jgi:hypothetical protein
MIITDHSQNVQAMMDELRNCKDLYIVKNMIITDHSQNVQAHNGRAEEL